MGLETELELIIVWRAKIFQCGHTGQVSVRFRDFFFLPNFIDVIGLLIYFSPGIQEGLEFTLLHPKLRNALLTVILAS